MKEEKSKVSISHPAKIDHPFARYIASLASQDVPLGDGACGGRKKNVW